MKVSMATMGALLYAYVIFILSFILLTYYTEGDQEVYIRFYQYTPIFDKFSDVYEYYNKVLTASEPVYPLLVYWFSPLIDKNIFISLLNTIIIFYTSKWMLIKRVNPIIILFLVFNFYLWVIFLPAERLKLGILFILLGVFYQGRVKYLFYLPAFLSHFQSLVMLAGLEFEKITSSVLQKKNRLLFFLAALVVAAVGIILYQNISYKIMYYHNKFGGLHGVIKPLMFMVLSLFCIREGYKKVFFIFIPIVLASVIFGSDRLTIFAYFVFMYYGLQYNRGLNIPVFITMSYFTVKGLLFLSSVIIHGNGFYKG